MIYVFQVFINPGAHSIGTMNQQRLHEFCRSMDAWNRVFHGYVTPPVFEARSDVADVRSHARNLQRRMREGPDVPARVAFFGATGAGKSKLFSSVIQRIVSRSGFRRPFTRRACYYLHRDWQSLQGSLEGEVHVHGEAEFRGVILIDTPDFDSIESANRTEAERVAMEADAFVFVTDALKYADASTWTYLSGIHKSAKEFLIVLNKTNSDVVRESFLERYRSSIGRRGGADEILPIPIVIPEFPIDDETLIDATEPSLVVLRNAVIQLGSNEGPTSRSRLVRIEAEGLFRSAAQALENVDKLRLVAQELHHLLGQRLNEAELQLESRLVLSLDQGMRDAVYQRVLNRVEQMDVLRYPRRILSFPARAARQLLAGWWRGTENAPRVATTEGSQDDPTSAETFQLLEAEVLRFTNQVRVDILASEHFADLLSRDRYRELKFDHDELKQRFAAENAGFREWVANHAQSTAAQITNENKAKFFISQLLFNSALITAQIHSGGLSLMELGLDGVVSPFMAKGVGMLIGNEKVQEFEKSARAEHQRVLARILAEARDRFGRFISDACNGLEELHDTLTQITGFRDDLESLVAAFESRSLPSKVALAETVPIEVKR